MAGFVKNTEYDIFVKSLKNRIDKARCTKYISINSNNTEDVNVLTDNSTPVDIIGRIDGCNERSTTPQEKFTFIGNDFQVDKITIIVLKMYIYIFILSIALWLHL